jgi:hypothetical protein
VGFTHTPASLVAEPLSKVRFAQARFDILWQWLATPRGGDLLATQRVFRLGPSFLTNRVRPRPEKQVAPQLTGTLGYFLDPKAATPFADRARLNAPPMGDCNIGFLANRLG